MSSNAPVNAPVRHRRVFYIPGYDPIPPRRYRELYRKESAAQSVVSGHEISILPSEAKVRFGWGVKAHMDGAEVETQVEVLVWSDIVKGSMDRGILATYAQLIRTAATYIGTGALFRLMRLRKGPVIAALYPVGFLLAQLGLALLSAWILGQGLAASGCSTARPCPKIHADNSARPSCANRNPTG